ncbi:signal peptidase I [candidate division KSB1 bacterium]|nr:signal peptidase I [candidate division KSB1 bacterium]
MSGFDPSLQRVKHSSERLLPSRAFVELLRAVLNKGADFRLRAKGFSMYPFIQDGDLVTLAVCDTNKIRVGDVVAIPHPACGNLIIHRIISLKNGLIRTKGDYNPFSDGWIKREDILACVVRVQRRHREVRHAHTLVQKCIVIMSRFLKEPRLRLNIYKTLLIKGECY